ncbi:hypothetical protein SELMODRAFT_418656 [Selaginella moellendorffii]|uniref:Uncharacterized protein n=1 Tax=Selaginella moellendorffii TaxID=88036 RepID=D8S6Q8_SELML|nr:hypothetical protein SELMODRAFT_418656 [Selaginella moellendorffii]
MSKRALRRAAAERTELKSGTPSSARCASLGDARTTFGTMPRKDVVSWNSLIAAYSVNGYGDLAFDLNGSFQACGRHVDQDSSLRSLIPSRVKFEVGIAGGGSRIKIERHEGALYSVPCVYVEQDAVVEISKISSSGCDRNEDQVIPQDTFSFPSLSMLRFTRFIGLAVLLPVERRQNRW